MKQFICSFRGLCIEFCIALKRTILLQNDNLLFITVYN